MRLLAHKEGLPTEVALLLFEFSDLLAEFFFHIADHLRRGAVWELFRQLAASGEFGFYCLLFPNPIHNCMTAAQGESSKKPRKNSRASFSVFCNTILSTAGISPSICDVR